MNKYLKKILPSTKQMKDSKQVKGLKSYLTSPCFWSYDLQPVARGVAAGLAGAVIPGFQIFYATLLVIVFRGNLSIALLCTLVTNPLTVVPITYGIYWIGEQIINNGSEEVVIKDFYWDFTSLPAFWTNFTAWISQFGKAFLVGIPIASVVLALAGYFGTLLLWELHALIFKKKK